MYAFVDRPVATLNNAGRFTLWAMRGWAHAVEQGSCPPLALSGAFGRLGVLPALPDFHIAMALINRGGKNPLSVAPLNCPHIVEHEAVLMTLWRDISLGQLDHMKATLALIVEETSVSPVSRAMIVVAAKMMAGGFDLSGLSIAIMKETR